MNDKIYREAEQIINKLKIICDEKELLLSVIYRVKRLEKEVEQITKTFKLVQKENEKYQNFAIALKEILPEEDSDYD